MNTSDIDGYQEKLTFSMTNDPLRWDCQGIDGYVTFASYADAKRAEIIFNGLERENAERDQLRAQLAELAEAASVILADYQDCREALMPKRAPEDTPRMARLRAALARIQP